MKAVVTGASRGIGFAVTTILAARGWEVIGLSRTGRVETQGGPITLLRLKPTDVTDVEAVTGAFAAAAEGDHPPTLLINCAGVVSPGPAADLQVADVQQQIQTNLFGTWLCTREFVRHLHGRSGVVVNVGSTSGSRPSPGWAIYGATKAALHSLTASLDEELKPRGVRVFGVSPGRTATALRKQLAPDEDPRSIMQPPEVAKTILEVIQNPLLAGQVVEVKG